MKKLFVLACILLMALGVYGIAFAGDGGGVCPDGVDCFEYGGKYCIRDAQLGKLICWCKDECGGNYVCQPTSVPTDEPTRRPPTSTPEPTETSPIPTRTEKGACNRGLGNGAEGCDPGNSGGKPGAAGEGNE